MRSRMTLPYHQKMAFYTQAVLFFHNCIRQLHQPHQSELSTLKEKKCKYIIKHCTQVYLYIIYKTSILHKFKSATLCLSCASEQCNVIIIIIVDVGLNSSVSTWQILVFRLTYVVWDYEWLFSSNGHSACSLNIYVSSLQNTNFYYFLISKCKGKGQHFLSRYTFWAPCGE